ncbi:MAG: YheU family protein [Magnetococcales bacterium]|nr:YheU family protein [Magnetococcales bacterium]
MDIPADQLSHQALEGIIEEFVSQEGTDYGLVEVSLQEKVAQVKEQIRAGEVVIRFDSQSQSCGIFRKK